MRARTIEKERERNREKGREREIERCTGRDERGRERVK